MTRARSRMATCAWMVIIGGGCGPPAMPTDPRALEESCAAARLPSCVSLAYAYATGAGVTQDPARSAALHDQVCRGGLVVGCVNLGVQLALGTGLAQDRGHAARLFRDACLGGPADDPSVPVGCVNLGVLIDGGFTEPAGQTSQGLFDRACHAGYPTGCRYAGLALLPTEPVRADAFLNLACQRGDQEACTQLDRHGRGDPIEFDEAILFAKVTYHY
jgi:uncharacterized protein